MSESLRSTMAKIHALELEIIENSGELTPEQEREYTEVQVHSQDAVERYYHFMNRLEQMIDSDKALEGEIRARRSGCERVFKRLKDNIKEGMAMRDLKELQGVDAVFKISRGKPSLCIDEEKLDPMYKKVIQTMVPDRERIEDALNQGREVIGAHYEESPRLTRTLIRRIK